MTLKEFVLPDVGEGIDAAELVEWKVQVGDTVAEDQPLADIETDKAVVQLPCPTSGTVAELRFSPGERIEVGAVIATFTQEQAAPGPSTESAVSESAVDQAPSSEQAIPAAAHRSSSAPKTIGQPSRGAANGSRPLASPATRRYARERGVDLRTLAGTGPAGRIERHDIDAALTRENGIPAPAVAPGASPMVRREHSGRSGHLATTTDRGDETVPLTGIRRTIAHRLTAAWQEVPRVVDYREVDATRLLAARARLREAARARGDEELARQLSLLPFLLKIASRAIQDHPYVNSSVDLAEDTITLHGAHHFTIAVATPDGLMTPVVRDVDQRSLASCAREASELSAAAQARTLRPDQFAGGTFTVNNFGSLGIWLGTPIVVPPQVANLGVGRLEERPVVVDGEVVVRPIIPLSVSGDHRVLDGHTLAAFVSRVLELMEDPALLLEEAV